MSMKDLSRQMKRGAKAGTELREKLLKDAREREQLLNAYEFARLTEHAYRIAAEQRATNKLAGGRVIEKSPSSFGGWRCVLVSRGPLQYLKCRHQVTGELAIVVTGTNEWIDWLVNGDVRMAYDVDGLGWHMGYRKLGEKLAHSIFDDADLNGADPLTFVGHSLGAAVASIAASRMPERVRKLIALDPPRYCNAEAADWMSKTFEGRAMRYTRGASIVARWPFEWRGYDHPEWVTSLHHGDAEPGVLDFWPELWAALPIPGIQTLEHHSMAALTSAMAQALGFEPFMYCDDCGKGLKEDEGVPVGEKGDAGTNCKECAGLGATDGI